VTVAISNQEKIFPLTGEGLVLCCEEASLWDKNQWLLHKGDPGDYLLLEDFN